MTSTAMLAKEAAVRSVWHRAIHAVKSIWRGLPQALKISLVLMLGLLLVAIFGPTLAPYPPAKIDIVAARESPSAEHWLGTDHLGRDVFTRLLYGTRISLLVGIGAMLPAAIIGLFFGVTAGYFGGWFDEVLMRLTDVFLAFPLLILAMGISVALGRGLPNAVVAMTVTLWPNYARLVRSEALLARTRDYVVAARSIGMSPAQIIWRHIVPNCPDALIAQASQDVGVAIIVVASLSFLGMGAQPPTPEWGAMILEGRQYLRDAWWISTFSGLAMFVTVSTFTMLGDGLRDRLDRGRGGVAG